MNCDCINQGFLCREYWKDCPKCSGTGTCTNIRRINLTKYGYLTYHHPNDIIVCMTLWDPTDAYLLHKWSKDNDNSYTGALNFAYLNTELGDGKRKQPITTKVRNLFFLHEPKPDDVEFFSKFVTNNKEYFFIDVENFNE